MATVYLADIGFRPAGVRLVGPVFASDGKRTVTLVDLIATPQGTDLVYHLTGLTSDDGDRPRTEVVAVRSADEERVVTQGTFLLAHADRRVVPRRITSSRVLPRWTGPVAVSIKISGLGEFRLAAELRPFGPQTDTPRRDVNASATVEGITVTVRGVGVAGEETAIEVEVGTPEGECCVGIGGYEGHRLGPSALSLQDQSGRAYMERWQEPGRFDHATTALFHPLHPEARELELSVPYIFVEERVATEPVQLPITTPVETRLGRHRIRLLRTLRVAGDPRASGAYREPALGVDLDLGGWNAHRRVLIPGQVLVDGDFCNLGYRLPEMDMRRPEPVGRVEVIGDRAFMGKTIAFRHPAIQVRGPWRVRFPLA